MRALFCDEHLHWVIASDACFAIIAPTTAQARSCACDSQDAHRILCISDMTRVQRDTRNFRFPRVYRGAE